VWDDNPATVDLIGFTRYAEVVARMVADERLLPVTIGVYGEWGSGKSTVMHLAERRLAAETNVVCTTFNGWMYQGYDDAKAALMTKIIEALKAERGLGGKALEKAEELLKKVDWLRLTAMTLRHIVMPLAASHATGIAPALSMPTTGDIGSMVTTAEESPSAIQTIEKFREEFSDLLKAAGVKTLVVFVDDLDRCVPSVVVDVLEAIKLFLSVEGTAFVIGADQTTIKQAVTVRYPQEKDLETVSNIYLEKIVQVPIHLHALGEGEAVTYLNLLFAQLHQASSEFEALAEVAAENRRDYPLRPALDFAVIKSTLGDKLKPDYVRDLGLVARIAPIVCQHERGNPRQLKRFLNTILLRQHLAAAHGLRLDVQILSKLMILEYYHTEPHYRQLFEWQVAGAGVARQLSTLEAGVRGAAPQPELEEEVAQGSRAPLSPDVAEVWLKNDDVRRWLGSEPSLARVDLEQYFFVARERLAKYGFEASGLSRNVREILSLLLSEDDIQRERGKGLALNLANTEAEGLFSTACGRMAQVADPSAYIAVLCDIAEERSVLIPLLITGLQRVPDGALPTSVPNRVRRLGLMHPDHESSTVAFLNGLTHSTNRMIKRAAGLALATGAGGD
jgi:hypothetical protein